MEGFGPVRYDAAKDTFEDNPDALLDVADLVFIDPLGTGESAPFMGTKPAAAWGAEGDARATLSVMQQWLVDHGRQGAPVYVVGESYGTARAAAMLHFASAEEAAPVKGVALLSLALGGLPDPTMQAAGRLPSMAATAWYHHMGSADLSSGMEAYQRAVSAQAPSSVPEAPAFRKALLADSGKIVGSLDTRMTADHSLDALQPPYSDPGMTLGKRPSTLMARYLVSLGYRSPVAYRMLNLAINTSWNYGGSPDEWPFAGYVAEGMKGHPSLKLFTAGGIYDLSTPAYEGILTLRQVGVPANRWEAHIYPSGHTIGEDATQRPVLAADLRRFIRGN
jgi:carboxypeptidase C (cathepsin A)